MTTASRVRVTAIALVLGLGLAAYLGALVRFRPALSGTTLPPLGGREIVLLKVPEAPDALVIPPKGTTAPSPVVLILTSTQNPIADCVNWRPVVGPRPFILCPQLVVGDTPQSLALATAALRGSLRALKARWPRHVAPGPIVLVGWGPAAAVATKLSQQEPSFFSRLVLGREQLNPWTSSFATIYRRRGGERLLLACDDPTCAAQARRAKLWMQGAGLEARLLESAPGESLEKSLASTWPWLVEGDQRWSSGQPSNRGTH
jgi:hypothetical protein